MGLTRSITLCTICLLVLLVPSCGSDKEGNGCSRIKCQRRTINSDCKPPSMAEILKAFPGVGRVFFNTTTLLQKAKNGRVWLKSKTDCDGLKAEANKLKIDTSAISCNYSGSDVVKESSSTITEVTNTVIAASTSSAGPDGDGDKCCQTQFFTVQPVYEQNINGVYRTIIHGNNAWEVQHVSMGLCSSPGAVCNSGTNQGTCTQQSTTQWLLVWAGDYGAFEPFTIPTYCSCL